jgi:tRNA (guanine26-N2/guanine27-N2)-dimethyltransferase
LSSFFGGRNIVSSVSSYKIREGSTELIVPDQIEPTKYPSFFNPRGKLVRNVSVVCYEAFAGELKKSGAHADELTFADSLCGTGARGIRVANEVREVDRVFLNDVSSLSIDLAKKSARENDVEQKCVFSQEEACSFLSARNPSAGERFDIVDVDPFGTPSPFVECALRAVKHGGMLSISATDTAVLCGVYPRVAQRKYLGLPLRTDYAHEIGMRLIFGLLSMSAMRLESSIEPLFCHHDMHYFRAYCTVGIGNSYSRQNESEIGFVLHCFKCGSRKVVSRSNFFMDIEESLECTECASQGVKFAGPLWIGKIQSQEFVASCAKNSDLSLFQSESDIPLYFDLTEISDIMDTRTPKIMDVIAELNSIGHSAGRTRLNRNAVRTDAPPKELRKILARLSL